MGSNEPGYMARINPEVLLAEHIAKSRISHISQNRAGQQINGSSNPCQRRNDNMPKNESHLINSNDLDVIAVFRRPKRFLRWRL
jgi:hypothetical protein